MARYVASCPKCCNKDLELEDWFKCNGCGHEFDIEDACQCKE